jgi:hypothetical protein
MPSERKRPFYIVLALIGALALGTLGSCDGWLGWMRYQEPPPDVSLVGQGISDPADRTAVEARADAFEHTLDAAKSRGWPLAVGTLLLGSAVLVFAMRTLGGSPGARGSLVQVVVAQAGLALASCWLMRDVTAAATRLYEAATVANAHERVPRGAAADDALRVSLAITRTRDAVQLVLSTLGSVFVVVALTTRRARTFFDASPTALEER